MEGPDPCLAPGRFVDSAHPAIVALASSLRQETPAATAVRLFDWVRDHVTYVALPPLEPHDFLASTVLERRWGYCVQKAALLAALGRAAGLPSRLGFADVRNHQLPPAMREAMGTNLFAWHGYTEFRLDGRWVKATPAFDPGTAARAGVLPVTLDGVHDALMHPVDPRGNPYIEYVAEHGLFDDVPYEVLQASIRGLYGEPLLRAAWEARAARMAAGEASALGPQRGQGR